MLSDADVAFVATALALCKHKGKKIATGPRNGTNEDRNTHTKSHDRLNAERAKRL
jgi:hypothetical protein